MESSDGMESRESPFLTRTRINPKKRKRIDESDQGDHHYDHPHPPLLQFHKKKKTPTTIDNNHSLSTPCEVSILLKKNRNNSSQLLNPLIQHQHDQPTKLYKVPIIPNKQLHENYYVFQLNPQETQNSSKHEGQEYSIKIHNKTSESLAFQIMIEGLVVCRLQDICQNFVIEKNMTKIIKEVRYDNKISKLKFNFPSIDEEFVGDDSIIKRIEKMGIIEIEFFKIEFERCANFEWNEIIYEDENENENEIKISRDMSKKRAVSCFLQENKSRKIKKVEMKRKENQHLYRCINPSFLKFKLQALSPLNMIFVNNEYQMGIDDELARNYVSLNTNYITPETQRESKYTGTPIFIDLTQDSDGDEDEKDDNNKKKKKRKPFYNVWNPRKVAELVDKIRGLEGLYCGERFILYGIDGSQLNDIGVERLKEIGIIHAGERSKVIDWIKNLKKKNDEM